MNKQEATEFILQELAYHRAPTEIANQLAGRLNAPYAAVERFVLQVAAQHPVAPSPAAPAAAPLQPASSPPGKKSAYPPLPTAHTPPVEPEQQPWEAKARLKNDLLEDEKLAADVLRRLNQGQDRNDIITMVCERAGTSWPQAQRLVSQVEVDNYQKLTIKRNLPVFLGSIVTGIVGIILTISGLIAAAPYLSVLTGAPISVPPALRSVQTTPDVALATALGGAGLVLGSVVGIYYALQEHHL